MGYLLKEALKTLCGVNQWSYAVYWKIGCQNPKLIIWEDCYHEPLSYSSQASGVHFLVNKMMVDNHVNIVGQGLVGRAAFAGNHHWILPNCFKETFPPEVLKEVFQQFSAGIQTVAVIPVLPHGVVQFGSCQTIMENVGFVQDVKSLVSQLEILPGAMLPENYGAKELDVKSGMLECLANNTPVGLPFESNVISDSSLFNSLNYFGNSIQTSMFESQPSYSSAIEMQKNERRSDVAEFRASGSSASHVKPQNYHQNAKIISEAKPSSSAQNRLINGVAKAEVITSNAEIWMNQQASQYIPRSSRNFASGSSSSLNRSMINCTESEISTHGSQSRFSDTNVTTGTLVSPLTNCSSNFGSNDGLVTVPTFEISGLCQGVSSIMEPAIVENITSMNQDKLKNVNFGEGDKIHDFGAQIYSPNIVQPQSGDDLFDILGPEYKSSLLSSCWNGSLSNELTSSAHNWSNNSIFPSKASCELYSTTNADSESAIFNTPVGTDHLLDAVVSTSKVQPSATPSLDDNVSCSTTLTNISSSSLAIKSLPYGRFGVSDQLKAELLGLPKYQEKAGAMSSCSKEASVTYSQTSSIYGSHVSSWVGKGQSAKQSNSVTTGHSKKPDEVVKTNRKRLKPGESPRPRPKDRQMIQDRVKELREIVPNGGKCSIDALLERTIKHMLFLQSVTKHADKLKQSADSKIISKDGGLLLKDNYEGGATWAYEVGSQSMVCPIIVEDLNQPRQMLVEMLCEERGLFLEIADIIRGMGLTILKGVMETRNDKIWARFSVEANRDVTRMEIFLSLVRLLDQTAKTCASQSNGVSCENKMLHQLHQAAPVPMTSSQ